MRALVSETPLAAQEHDEAGSATPTRPAGHADVLRRPWPISNGGRTSCSA